MGPRRGALQIPQPVLATPAVCLVHPMQWNRYSVIAWNLPSDFSWREGSWEYTVGVEDLRDLAVRISFSIQYSVVLFCFQTTIETKHLNTHLPYACRLDFVTYSLTFCSLFGIYYFLQGLLNNQDPYGWTLRLYICLEERFPLLTKLQYENKPRRIN